MNDNGKSESVYQLSVSLLLIILQNEIAGEIAVSKCLKTFKQNHNDSAAVHENLC